MKIAAVPKEFMRLNCQEVQKDEDESTWVQTLLLLLLLYLPLGSSLPSSQNPFQVTPRSQRLVQPHTGHMDKRSPMTEIALAHAPTVIIFGLYS